MNRINTEKVNVYKILDPSKIDSYGSHISIGEGLQGRLSSLLHWNPEYDQKNFAQYCVEWAQVNSKKDFVTGSATNKDFFDALNAVRTLDNFAESNSRAVAQLILDFKKETYKDQISSIISQYLNQNNNSSEDPELKEESSQRIDINEYIQAIINKLKIDTKDKGAQSIIQTTWDSMKSALKENLIFETTCSMSAYLYALSPILDTTLNELTHSMFFTYFWAYLFSGIVASLSVTLIGGLLPGGLQGLQTEWKKAVSDDNSFHPIVDAIIGSIYIASSWLLIDKLEANVQMGSLFYILAQYGIKNYALKYFTMNLFFTLKAQIHQGCIEAHSLMQAALGGIIRGLLKNSMLNSMNHFFIKDIKLQLASNLQTYTAFLADNYLKEWWINQVVAKSMLASPLCLLKDNPAKLISAFWLAAEIGTICITSFSKVLEVMAIATLLPIFQKANDYRGVSLALIAIVMMYQKIQLGELLSS